MHYIIKVGAYDIDTLVEISRERLVALFQQLEAADLQSKKFATYEEAHNALIDAGFQSNLRSFDIVKIPFSFQRTSHADRQAFLDSLRGKR